MIRWALAEMRNRDGSTPRSPSIPISSSNTWGSMTTPEAITGVTPGYITPDGTNDSANRSDPTTIVCPALLPPW